MNDLMTTPASPVPAPAAQPWETGQQAYSPPAAPSQPAPPSATLLANMDELARRQAEMGNTQYRERMALLDAFEKEVSAGGDGSIALGKTPETIRGEELAEASEPEPLVKPGQHDPAAYSREAYGLFADPAEALAFGEVASQVGLDPDLVASAQHSIRNDRAIAAAIEGGDDAIDQHLAGVRKFFEGLRDGPARLNLAVAFLNDMADRNPAVADAVNAAMMSPDALSMIAYHAEQSGFRPTPLARR